MVPAIVPRGNATHGHRPSAVPCRGAPGPVFDEPRRSGGHEDREQEGTGQGGFHRHQGPGEVHCEEGAGHQGTRDEDGVDEDDLL